MVMKGTAIIILIVLIYSAIPLAAAVNAQITITTLANRAAEVWILDPNPTASGGGDVSNLLEQRAPEDIGSDGQLSFSFTTDKPAITLSIIITKDGVRETINGKTVHKFENLKTSEPINVRIIPGESEEQDTGTLLNETNEVTTEQNNETTEETRGEIIIDASAENQTEAGAGLTGQAISGDNEKSSFLEKLKIPEIPKFVYFIGAGILLGTLIVFLVLKLVLPRIANRGPEHFKVKKYSEMMHESAREKQIEIKDSDISKAEKKIREAQEELDKIKEKKNRREEAVKKFEEAKRELEKLEKED